MFCDQRRCLHADSKSDPAPKLAADGRVRWHCLYHQRGSDAAGAFEQTGEEAVRFQNFKEILP